MAPVADQPDAAAISGRRDKDFETPTDDRSIGERAIDRLAGTEGTMVEELQAAYQGVNPIATRQLGKRLGSLDEADNGLVIVPDARGILDKTIYFDPAKHVYLGNDVYERVPETEESRAASLGRLLRIGTIDVPPGIRLPGVKVPQAARAGTRAAQGAATEGRVAGEAAKAGSTAEPPAPSAPGEHSGEPGSGTTPTSQDKTAGPSEPSSVAQPSSAEELSGTAAPDARSVGQRILDFVLRRRAQPPDAPYERTQIMPVTPEEAERVKAETGLDIAGRQHVIASDYLRHIENRHGPDSGDRWPLTSDDWARLPEVLSTPDQVELSQETHLGLPVIRYQKQIGDH